MSLTIASSRENRSQGQSAEYALANLDNAPAQNVVRFHLTLGPIERHTGSQYQWILLEGVKQNGDTYACWVSIDRLPWASTHKEHVRTARYLLREGNQQPLEYVTALTGEALLPEFRGWDILFPKPVRDSKTLFAERMHFLGFDFSLAATSEDTSFSIPDSERLALRPDMLVGTGRNFRDVQGARLIDNEDYDYTPYSREDIDELIDAGVNHFW